MVSLSLEPLLDADVLVVGAGPAGAAAAAHLARGGVDVLLLDRQRFPRDKVCGDFVGPMALLEAEALGVGSLPAFEESNRIRHASVFLDGEHLVTAPMPRRAGLPAEGTIGDVEYATADWVDWYNNRRLHSTIGMMTPVEFEQAHYAALNREPHPV